MKDAIPSPDYDATAGLTVQDYAAVSRAIERYGQDIPRVARTSGVTPEQARALIDIGLPGRKRPLRERFATTEIVSKEAIQVRLVDEMVKATQSDLATRKRHASASRRLSKTADRMARLTEKMMDRVEQAIDDVEEGIDPVSALKILEKGVGVIEASVRIANNQSKLYRDQVGDPLMLIGAKPERKDDGDGSDDEGRSLEADHLANVIVSGRQLPKDATIEAPNEDH